MAPNSFSLLSLNTFGLPFYLGWFRMARLVSELSRFPATMVCLQEIQQNAFLPLIVNGMQDYPHHAFEKHVYAPKGGLVSLSRLPLTRSQFLPYQDRGRWWSLGVADWALYKGVLLIEVFLGGQKIVVLNTHLHANYIGEWIKSNSIARIQHSQVRDIAALVRDLADEVLVIVCGDFNFPRNTFLYRELLSETGLVDPLANDLRPTYKPFPLVPSRWSIPIDYMLVRPPYNNNLHISADVLPVENSQARWPFQRFLTDHYALSLQVEW